MSDLITPTDVELLNSDEYRKAQLRGALSGLNILPGALTQVLPAAQDERGNVRPALPGIVTAPYGFLGGTVPDLANWVGKKAGYDLNIPHAPGAEAAQQTYEDTSRLAQKILPVEQLAPAQSEGEQIMHDALRSGGGMLVSIPGTQMAKLPIPARVVAGFMAPTTEAAPVVAALQTTATAGLEGYAADQDKKSIAGILSDAVQGPKQDEALPVPSIPPAQQAAQTATPATAPVNTVGDALSQAITSNADSPAPTFTQQGESGVTVGQVLGGVALVAGALLAGKHFGLIGTEVSQAARDARLRDPAYAQKATDFANQKLAATSGTQISGQDVQAPLPKASVFAAAQNNAMDSSALARHYIDLTADDPATATKLGHQTGLVMNDMAWQSRLRAFLTTGVDDQTKLSMPPPRRLFEDIQALPADKQKMLNDGLLAANELDNRRLMQSKGQSPAAYDFYNQNDQDLARLVVDMQRDPVLKDIADRYSEIGRRLIAIGETRQFFTPAESRLIMSTHPNHVADVDVNGRVLHALGPRDIAPRGGIDQANSTAWNALAQHIETLYRQYELNELRNGLTTHFLDWQNQPGAAKVLEQVHPPSTQPSLYSTVAPSGGQREPIISVRRGNGPEFYKVHNHDLYTILTGGNGLKMRTAMDMMSVPRRLLQSGTTGVLSTLSGRVFPLVNATRTAFQAPINRPAGYAGGLIDAAMQRATMGKLGYRGFDPTNFVGAAYSGARAGVDDLALHLSDLFDKSNPNFATQKLKTLITPQRMDVIRDGLRNYYSNTVTAEMRAQGLGGQGVPFRSQVPAFRTATGQSDNAVRLVSGQLAPRLFMPPGKLGTVRAHWLNLQRAAEDIFQSISDSGHEYFYRLNRARGIDPTNLTYETRALTGDPGVSGAGRVVSGLRTAIPYANVSAQGVGRYVRAFRDTPVGTTMAATAALGSAALLSLYTAMRNSDTREHLQNSITTQGRAANVILYGSDDPMLNTQYSLPQELRPQYAMMLDLISKLLNHDAMSMDDAHHDSVYSFMKDWFSEHVENSTWESALHGLADTLNIVDIPSIFNAVSAMSGTSTRIDLERIVNDVKNGQFGMNTFVMPAGTDAPLPNHPPGDNLLEGQDAKKFGVMLSNALGMVGTLWDRATGFDRYYKQSGDAWASLGQVGKDWLQAAKDANPGLNNIIWENPVRESVRPPIVESVQRQLNIMKQTAGANTAERYEGTTGGTRPLEVAPQSGAGRIPTDPVMRKLYFATNAEYNFINSSVMTDINAMKKRMANVAEQPMDNTERRKWMNEQTRIIADKYRYIQARIDDLNAAFSKMVGKHVDVSGIDWSKGQEQF